MKTRNPPIGLCAATRRDFLAITEMKKSELRTPKSVVSLRSGQTTKHRMTRRQADGERRRDRQTEADRVLYGVKEQMKALLLLVLQMLQNKEGRCRGRRWETAVFVQ